MQKERHPTICSREACKLKQEFLGTEVKDYSLQFRQYRFTLFHPNLLQTSCMYTTVATIFPTNAVTTDYTNKQKPSQILQQK
jgi:hypothetical protein